jgi:hypothetical protein
MSRGPAFVAVLLVASSCQRTDTALESRLAMLEREHMTHVARFDKFANATTDDIARLQRDVAFLQGDTGDEKCVTTTGSGVQSVGDYLVSHIELTQHAQGARLRGLLINPTSIEVQGLKYRLRWPVIGKPKGGLEETELAVLERIRPGGSAGFAVLLPNADPSKVSTVCFEIQDVSYHYGVPLRRPQ